MTLSSVTSTIAVTSKAPGLVLRNLSVAYRTPGRPTVRAVAGVSLSVTPGQVVGLVGESGCGKSTLGKAAVGLLKPAAGLVEFDGRPVVPLGLRSRPTGQRGLQMVFQDPYASLNPRRRVGEQISDAVVLAGGTREKGRGVARELLERVGLPPEFADRFPHEFSGGQRQRIAIARVLAAEPTCIVADEPIAALDASAQASVANLLLELARERNVGLLFISHDLSIVRQIADTVAVMYLGTVVESGPTDQVWAEPRHPYSKALIAAVPRADGSGELPVDLPGDVPDPAFPPAGCRFHPRCPVAVDACADAEPALVEFLPRRRAACTVLAPTLEKVG
ncbi:oligopeptide/dipeptide ABC transporter ATP-binding protein [Embleya scabrispora]|uniref:oligopeptide/dipeptide ABC transporter ATP-binding protein n=1 Tax=Embleya scabrispora TaxID=159449 RepID=UPI00035DDB97|nr:ABC transporter ATP-binding protein [Embleya scabrispora]MYS83876.1 ATP-binding cassette domain-containing protein [Streptomyces sp. SID5474]